jgi:UDP-N-acetylmuramoylalanine--D-glutamate ligase
MLNLSVDHLDRHGDMEGYASAKRHVFDRQTPDDLGVLGIDDSFSPGPLAARVVTISGHQQADVWCDHGVLRRRGEKILDMGGAKTLPGVHNAQNAAAAAAVAHFLGIDDAAIARGVQSFPGLAHRQQLITTRNGISYVNDSKATNADAAARAIVCYDKIVWIAGGMAKSDGIDSLAPLFPRIALALLIGRDAGRFAETLAAHEVPYRIVGTLEAAVPAARAAAEAGAAPVVLLSPACASWDQFTGFDARGDRFAELVCA